MKHLIAARVESLWEIYCGELAVESLGTVFSDTGNDSFDQIEFVMDLEEEFGIRITDEEESAIGGMTLDALTKFITGKLTA